MQMLKVQMENHLNARSTMLLYGLRSSGKTTFMREILKSTNTKYIEINCNRGSKLLPFLKLVNLELHFYLTSKGVSIPKLSAPNNIQNWVGQIKELLTNHPGAREVLDGLYLFIDDIQELRIVETYLSQFCSCCSSSFSIRFNIAFCGIGFYHTTYFLEPFFRSMLTFKMPKPSDIIKQVINTTVRDSLAIYCSTRKTKTGEIDKIISLLTTNIYESFIMVESGLALIQPITTLIAETVIQYLETDPYKNFNKMANDGRLREIISHVLEELPLEADDVKKKICEYDVLQNYEPILPHYPNLILASIHLAEQYNERFDKKRFMDYRNTNAKKGQMTREQYKLTKIKFQRVVAISQALEAEGRDIQRQKAHVHHTIDYYACFEYLLETRKLKFLGKTNVFGGGKITGAMTQQKESMEFMKKNNLNYAQFMKIT